MRLSIVIATRNNAGRLALTLKQLLRQTVPVEDYQVLVVDNASSDDTASVIGRFAGEFPNIVPLDEPVRSRGRARDRALRIAQGSVVLIVDDDIEVASDHLEQHLRRHSLSDEPVVVLGTVVDVSTAKPHWLEDYIRNRQRVGSGRRSPAQRGPLWPHFATGNVSLSRQALERVAIGNGLDRRFFDEAMECREDGELGLRLEQAGVRFEFAEDIVCFHHHPRTWTSFLQRTYAVGQSTSRLRELHPDLDDGTRWMGTCRLLTTLLRGACTMLFWLTRPIRSVWGAPLRKAIGGLLLAEARRGYTDARLGSSQR